MFAEDILDWFVFICFWTNHKHKLLKYGLEYLVENHPCFYNMGDWKIRRQTFSNTACWFTFEQDSEKDTQRITTQVEITTSTYNSWLFSW